MKINDAGLALIKSHEGLRLEAYKDPVGVWTIGYGHTAAAGEPAPRSGMKISKAEAEAILRRDLAKFEQAVTAAVKVPLNGNQFSALVSFCFNVGETAFRKSSVLKSVNSRNFSLVPGKLALWNRGGGKVLPGLTRRRKEEAALFMKPAAVPVGRPKPVEAVPVPAPEYSRSEVRDVQQRLLTHGYVQVGGIDGLIGDNTRGAIRDFRAKNSMPEGDHIDQVLIDALKRPDAVRPVIAPDRANASLKDLRDKGSVIVDAADKNQKGAIATIVAGIGAVGSQIVESAGGLMNLGPALDPLRWLFQEYGVWIFGSIIVGMGGFIWWNAKRSGEARLRDHQVGNTAMVNFPEQE